MWWTAAFGWIRAGKLLKLLMCKKFILGHTLPFACFYLFPFPTFFSFSLINSGGGAYAPPPEYAPTVSRYGLICFWERKVKDKPIIIALILKADKFCFYDKCMIPFFSSGSKRHRVHFGLKTCPFGWTFFGCLFFLGEVESGYLHFSQISNKS